MDERWIGSCGLALVMGCSQDFWDDEAMISPTGVSDSSASDRGTGDEATDDSG